MDSFGFLAAFLALTGLGMITGILTGLSPGLHVNNVAALVIATEGSWTGLVAAISTDAGTNPALSGALLSSFLIAAAATHSVFSFIPSVFLGAPTEETALATLPGHRLLLVGQGAKAVALASRGAILGTAFAVAILIPLRLLLAEPVDLAGQFHPWIPAFLVGVLAAILVAEFRRRDGLRSLGRAALVQGLAGLLGIATLRGSLPLDPDIVLFPLFSGLFGLPTLLLGLLAPRGRIPDQRLEPLRALSRRDVRGALRGVAAGAVISWLPGLSGGAAATLASVGSRRRVGPSQFMVVLGSVSSSTGFLSVAVLFMIRRSRSGAAAAIRALVGDVGPWHDAWSIPVSLVLVLVSAVVATGVAAPLATRVAREVARRWSRSNPRLISAASVLAILGLLGITSGIAGLAVAGCATLLGLVPIALRVRRVHLMASLLIPVLLATLAPDP